MRILAIDLGKSKSVACVYEVERAAARYRKVPTGPDAIERLIREYRPQRVVIGICSAAG